MLNVYMALYNTLVDDDEDVRDQGAEAVSFLLSAIGYDESTKEPASISLSPPAAKRRLLDFLQSGYHTSSGMCLRATERLTGLPILSYSDSPTESGNTQGEIELRPVAAIFADAEAPQLAVFVEEKQNLYVNPVEEAQAWAGVLLGLGHGAWCDQVVAAMSVWTQDGLVHFLDTFKKRGDGPLGLTSQPEIYTLLLRVVVSAEVLMSPPVQARGTGLESPLRSLLEQLLELGKTGSLHCLFTSHVRHVLET